MAKRKKRSSKLKIVLFLVVIIIIGAVMAVFMEYRSVLDNPEKLISKIPDGANISLGKIHHTATREGRTEWSLDANSANYINEKKQVILHELSLTFFLEDDREIFLTADQGILRTDTNDIQVTGNVVVEDPNFLLKTENLHYEHNNRKIYSKVRVRIERNSSHITADSMSLDLNTNKTLLQGKVEGTFGENFTL